jgi:hypothetical protein
VVAADARLCKRGQLRAIAGRNCSNSKTSIFQG